MKDLLETIIKSIVSAPNKVIVEEIKGNNSMILQVFADKDDFRKIVGINGKMIGSIRTILEAVASSQKSRVYIELQDHM